MEALKTPYAKVGVLVLVIGALVTLYVEVHASGSGVDDANARNYLDTSTGQPFKHALVVGEKIPIAAPSGEKTGYPAELCYWTADGQASDAPTSVVLIQAFGKRGPTFCPTCHRLVVGMNPFPATGVQPPPTEAEWNAKHGVKTGSGAK